jgi:hypothetical protein
MKTSFVGLFLVLFTLHITEDALWIGLARFTNVPTWSLFLGAVFWAGMAAVWLRRGR